MMSQRGSIKLSLVIAATLGVGLAASVFLNFQQHQRAEQDKKLLQGEITDLRYELHQGRLAEAATPTPEPSPTDSPSPSPSESPASTPTPAATPAVLGDAASASKTATVTAAANLRSSASASSSLVMRVSKGAVATLGSDLRNGYQQVTINGKTGYLLASYLK